MTQPLRKKQVLLGLFVRGVHVFVRIVVAGVNLPSGLECGDFKHAGVVVGTHVETRCQEPVVAPLRRVARVLAYLHQCRVTAALDHFDTHPLAVGELELADVSCLVIREEPHQADIVGLAGCMQRREIH